MKSPIANRDQLIEFLQRLPVNVEIVTDMGCFYGFGKIIEANYNSETNTVELIFD